MSTPKITFKGVHGWPRAYLDRGTEVSSQHQEQSNKNNGIQDCCVILDILRIQDHRFIQMAANVRAAYT